MFSLASESLDHVQIVPFDAAWAGLYEAEHARLKAQFGLSFVALEHIGSTAVAGLAAKPIIDMMAASRSLESARAMVPSLEGLGYQLIETGMRDRLFFRRTAPSGQMYHLHIVEHAAWPNRNERLLRDFLRGHPDVAAEYGALKVRLAAEFAHDSLAYTKAKTPLVQEIIDRARAEHGLPAVNVWED